MHVSTSNEEQLEREIVNRAEVIPKDLRTSDLKHYLVVSVSFMRLKRKCCNHNCINGIVTVTALAQSRSSGQCVVVFLAIVRVCIHHSTIHHSQHPISNQSCNSNVSTKQKLQSDQVRTQVAFSAVMFPET